MSNKHIEGSAARIADRGQDQLFGDNFPDGTPINSISTVDAVVRSFASKVVDVRVRYNKDDITDVQAQHEVQQLAQQYADIFMGKSKEYAAAAWNSPEQLGAYLAKLIESADPQTACLDFFLWIAAQLAQVMVEHEAEKIDDEAMQFRLDVLFDDAARALLGIPDMEMPEDDS